MRVRALSLSCVSVLVCLCPSLSLALSPSLLRQERSITAQSLVLKCFSSENCCHAINLLVVMLKWQMRRRSVSDDKIGQLKFCRLQTHRSSLPKQYDMITMILPVRRRGKIALSLALPIERSLQHKSRLSNNALSHALLRAPHGIWLDL